MRRATSGYSITGARTTAWRRPAACRCSRSTWTSTPTRWTTAPRSANTSTASCRRSAGRRPSACIERRFESDCWGARAQLSARLRAAGFFLGLGFDRFHVVVAQAEMMADLVDQHVAHDVRQVLARFTPVVEDRTAIEEDAVDVVGDVARAALHHRHALIKSQQVERRVELHLLLDLVGREVVDLDADVADMPAELLGDRGQRLGGDGLEIVLGGRRAEAGRAPRIGEDRHDSPI